MPNPCLITLDPDSGDFLARPGTIRLKLVSTSGLVTYDPTKTNLTDQAGAKIPSICTPECLTFDAEPETTYKVNVLHIFASGNATADLIEDCAGRPVLDRVDATEPDPTYTLVVSNRPSAETLPGVVLAAFVVAALSLFPCRALAAPKQPQVSCQRDIQASVLVYQSSPTPLNAREVRKYLDLRLSTPCIAAQIIRSASASNLAGAQLAQLKLSAEREIKAYFQQNGSSTGSGGSTNLVSKGTTANLLALASEYGQLTQSSSGQTVTAQGSLSGIPALLIGGNLFTNCGLVPIPDRPCLHTGLMDALARFSYSVAFDASQASQTINGALQSTSGPVSTGSTSAASPHIINSVCAKAVLVRGASAAASDIVKAISELLESNKSPTGDEGAEFVAAAAPLKSRVDQWTGFQQWENGALRDLQQSAPANILSTWADSIASLQSALCKQDAACRNKLLGDALAYGYAYGNYTLAEHKFIEGLRKTPLLSLEYDENRPLSQPTNSTFRLVYAQPVGAGWVMTLNGGASIYDSVPPAAIPGSSRMRDVQAATEAEYSFAKAKRARIFGNSTVSAAYYAQNQLSPAILDVSPGQLAGGVVLNGLPTATDQVYAPKGIIHIAQAKFTLRPGKSSLCVPLSVTWSNRTELLTSAAWRAQVGISYDLDSLFSGSAK